MRRLVTAATTAAMLLAPLAVIAATDPAAAQERVVPRLFQAVRHDRAFSPDGDGRADAARFVFRLDVAARVRVVVRGPDAEVVLNAKLGVLAAGRHVWRWDGRSAGGRLQPDGSYHLLFRATAGDRADRRGARTDLLTRPDGGRLLMSRPTVYPAATLVKDRVHVVYVREGYSSDIAAYPGYYDAPFLRTRLVVKDPDGQVVYDDTTHRYRAAFEWTARVDGVPLPPGDYLLRVTVRNPAGNVRTIRRTVSVSSAELAERVWTSTVAAADADLAPGPIYDPSCNGCGEVCGPVPSDRFPGGLSFRQPCSFGYAAVRYFGAAPPFVPAPVDDFRITATGGPTTPGAPDTGELSGVVTGPGDTTVTTPWTPVDLRHHPYVPDGDQPVWWSFSTSELNSYDVASFTVEYRYYVPV